VAQALRYSGTNCHWRDCERCLRQPTPAASWEPSFEGGSHGFAAGRRRVSGQSAWPAVLLFRSRPITSTTPAGWTDRIPLSQQRRNFPQYLQLEFVGALVCRGSSLPHHLFVLNKPLFLLPAPLPCRWTSLARTPSQIDSRTRSQFFLFPPVSTTGLPAAQSFLRRGRRPGWTIPVNRFLRIIRSATKRIGEVTGRPPDRGMGWPSLLWTQSLGLPNVQRDLGQRSVPRRHDGRGFLA